MKPKDEDTKQNPRFLLCDTAGNAANLSSVEGEWISTPIQCFDKAVEWKPEMIVIVFRPVPVRERETLVELSTSLKKNSHTKRSPVLALLRSKHRKLVEELKRAKVDYIRYIGEAKLNSGFVRKIIESLGSGDKPDRYLDVSCPFLHYFKINSQDEMTVCGAYLDRLVLGGRRLRELCELETHVNCEYFQHPRLGS